MPVPVRVVLEVEKNDVLFATLLIVVVEGVGRCFFGGFSFHVTPYCYDCCALAPRHCRQDDDKTVT